MNSKKKINIATILPYKENYSLEKASAASLWVSEFFKNSKFKNNIFIYGNTNSKNYLTKNYININLKSLNSKFQSTTTEYSYKLAKEIDKKKFDLIEIHNRPLILFNLLKQIQNRFIFYFHNDPLSMNGSKTIEERLFILKNVEKIIFVSEWVKNRFFLNLDLKLSAKTEIVYPSVNKQKTTKKCKYITFVGRLNHSKGYDIFQKSIQKILDEFPKWKSLSVGDEDRRSIYINHTQHKELGFLSHKKTLDILNQSEIAVVPSRWEEPFGRTALEASSRGCATIISNRGGLIETTNQAIILKKIDEKNLYKEIKKLILNNKKRKLIQRNSRKNIKHQVLNNTKFIDQIRESIFPIYNVNFLKNKIKIINLYNQGQKLNHRLFNISLGKKFTNGFIRNGNDVLEISDRDFIKNNKTYNLLQNSRVNFQNYLIETCKNYNPDLLFFGHTKNINLDTIKELKLLNKNLIISQWNEDPVMPDLSYSKQNITNINLYSDSVDHNFITTDPSVLKQKINSDNLHFFFVPVDKNIERFDVFKMNPKKDLFYAMSHGVNRAILKEGTEDNRVEFLDKLVKKISKIKYDFYGFANKQPIWGDDFNSALINSKMALNLSRGKPTKHYSSNRIASVVGNGLLTFVDKKVQMSDFFNNNEMIFYDNIADLSDKIKFYSVNDKLRKKIANNGKKKYFKLFNEIKITKYFIDISLGNKPSLF
ncbi:glycosyltransferase [Candidatus Pelagibacter giovannonii]|uniref:Glycosyltransferase n=1 Tax=Candidatus Pelagibacter giovannonii TaxID=2563896 RepID=A0A6H1Q1H7_9PROT|nr:glycosyltransferase [Candidatus Pelagibacter giovannonii]QIZ20360.1 glycosyltransferase [Candidatus Pelagibacter giovannonii]